MLARDDIIGHKEQIAQLEADSNAENVAHAYLFSGPRHVGKLAVAKWFAQTLLTQDLSEEEAHVAREQISRLQHPDFLVLDQLWTEGQCEDFGEIAKSSNVPQQQRAKPPEGRSKPKTDEIGINDIRALAERLHETGEGRWRCCLIRSVERLSREAANAFLKLLEEPPPGRVFLLTTQALSSLLPTITSRTRILRFRPLPEDKLRPLVADMPEEDARLLLRMACGAPGMIECCRADQAAFTAHKKAYKQAQQFWQSSSLSERLHAAKPLMEKGEQAERFLFHLALSLREEQRNTSFETQAKAIQRLAAARQANVHPQLLTQQFVLEVTEC